MQKIYDRFLILLIVTMLIIGPVSLVLFFFPQFTTRLIRALTYALGVA